MSFLTPLALSALALGALVAAAYFLKQRPRPYEVSALFLWPQASSKAQTAWRWYRAPVALLLVQLLALLVLVGALARPMVSLRLPEAGRIALIVDTSASMQTLSGGKTRFERAVQGAKEQVTQHKDAEFTLIEARKNGGVALALSHDWRSALAVLSTLTVSNQGDASLEAVLQWVQSQAAWETFSRVLWLSDRLPGEARWKEFPLEFALFQGGHNVAAISAFSLRSQPDATLGYEGFVRVENFSQDRLNTTLSVVTPTERVFSTALDVAAHGEMRYTFALPQLSAQLSAQLDAQDDLALDNTRYFAFQPQRPPRVLWLGQEDRFLAGALMALGVPDVVPWTAGVQLGPRDVLVVNAATLPADVKGNVLLLDADWEGVITTQFVYGVESMRATDLAHPVLRGVAPDDIVVKQSRLADLPQNFVTLLSADSQKPRGTYPALGVYQTEDVRLVWVGFSLEDSNLRLTVDFPILMANVLRWLVPSSLQAALLETGAPLILNKEKQTLISPSGEEITVGGEAFLGTDAPGFYVANDGGRVWAANVPASESLPLDESHSLTAPPVEASVTTVHTTALYPLWLWLGWLGFAVLVGEWLSYERGWL